MNPKRIYISGPMTGIPSYNIFAFNAAAERLIKAGWSVINPAGNFDGRTDQPREAYMRVDVLLLARCDAIAMLPMWRESRGARVEYLLARELGLELLDALTLQPLAEVPAVAVMLSPAPPETPPGESILMEAQRITSGARHGDYGHPKDDFAGTAAMWTGILAGKLRDGAHIAAMDIPLCMIAVKLARQSHRHKRDNLVDIAGYVRTAAMIAGDE